MLWDALPACLWPLAQAAIDAVWLPALELASECPAAEALASLIESLIS